MRTLLRAHAAAVGTQGCRRRPLLLVFAGLMLGRPLPRAVGEPVAYGVQALTALATCGLLVRRRRGVRSDGRLRRARLLLAGALVCGALAGVLALVVHVVTGQPPAVPSLPDAVHFGFLPLAVLGLLAYPTVDDEMGSALRSLLDGLVAALSLWFVAYVLLLEPAAVGQDLSQAAALTALAYPTADVFVLGVLAGALPRVAASSRRELVLIGSGFAAYLVSDVGYSVVRTGGGYRADSWVTLLAEVGLVLMLLAVCDDGALRTARPRLRGLSALPHLPVLAALGVGGAQGVTGGTVTGAPLASGVLMAAALLARQGVSSRDRRRLTDRLQAREELFRSLVNGGSDLITLTDLDGTVLWASPAVTRTLGRTGILGENLADSVHPDDRAVLCAGVLASREEPEGLAEVLCRLGSATGWRWMQVRLQDRSSDPAVGGLICNARDVHERHLLEQQLQHAAHHDALTGLGNLARARQLLGRCYAGGRPTALLLVDLDGFKAVNDTFGHAQGDALLGEVALRLLACLGEGDEVVRVGGDEFLLVLAPGSCGRATGARVLEAVRQPVVVAGTPLTVSASVGSAHASDACSPDELLRNADLAMYASKEAGRDRATAYEPEMHQRAARRMDVHRGLQAPWTRTCSPCTTSPSSGCRTACWSGPRPCCAGSRRPVRSRRAR